MYLQTHTHQLGTFKVYTRFKRLEMPNLIVINTVNVLQKNTVNVNALTCSLGVYFTWVVITFILFN